MCVTGTVSLMVNDKIHIFKEPTGVHYCTLKTLLCPFFFLTQNALICYLYTKDDIKIIPLLQ